MFKKLVQVDHAEVCKYVGMQQEVLVVRKTLYQKLAKTESIQ